MSRRPDPVRITAAQREGTRQRLISAGILPERVDELLAAFDALQEREGERWDAEAAYQWVFARRRA